jgi:predicted small secreted protein
VRWRTDIGAGRQYSSTHPGNGTSLEKEMKAFIAMTVATCFLFLGGCNTMEGAGKDTKAAGEKIEKEAVEHKKY